MYLTPAGAYGYRDHSQRVAESAKERSLSCVIPDQLKRLFQCLTLGLDTCLPFPRSLVLAVGNLYYPISPCAFGGLIVPAEKRRQGRALCRFYTSVLTEWKCGPPPSSGRCWLLHPRLRRSRLVVLTLWREEKINGMFRKTMRRCWCLRSCFSWLLLWFHW